MEPEQQKSKKGAKKQSLAVDEGESVNEAANSSTTSIKAEKNSGETKFDSIIYSWKNLNAWTGTGNSKTKVDVEDNHSELTAHYSTNKTKKKGHCNEKSERVKHLLKNVTGVALPYEVLAIMGTSGAGKSTLLNCLTFRNVKKLRITGDRCVNGVPVDHHMISSLAAYVHQDDLFIGTLTVREHLIFQAKLRMDRNIPEKQRLARVEEVIHELGLSKCAESLIGIPGRVKGISRGEMKRLSLASEILTDPAILIVDEPTSGLDSFMSHNVISVLKHLARKGKTILCTIHQPSSKIYTIFDKVLFVADGRTAFLGTRKEALEFFDSVSYKCPRNYNPAEFLIDKLAIVPDDAEGSYASVKEICDSYEDSDAAINVARILEQVKTLGEETDLVSTKQKLQKRSKYNASWCTQFIYVTWRCWLSIVRDPVLFIVRLLTSIAIAIMIGLIYLQQEHDQAGVMNINGVICLILAHISIETLFHVVNTFCAEVPIFLREHWNGIYRCDVYYLAKTLTDLPVSLTPTAVSFPIAYWMIGLNSDAGRFFTAYGATLIVTAVAGSYGTFISYSVSNVNLGLAIGLVLIGPFLIFGGVFLNVGDTPVYLLWLKYSSWFYYSNEALIINQWDGVSNITCSKEPGTPCIPDGDIVLKTLSFEKDHFVRNIYMLFVILVVFRILAFTALLIRSYMKN